MAHDHFQTPPDPERGYKNPKKSIKSLKVRAKPAKKQQEDKTLQSYPPMLGALGYEPRAQGGGLFSHQFGALGVMQPLP